MSRARALLLTICLAAGLPFAPPAGAHGERNQEPFLRMRTAHWYDVTWSADKVKVNDEVEVRGGCTSSWTGRSTSSSCAPSI